MQSTLSARVGSFGSVAYAVARRTGEIGNIGFRPHLAQRGTRPALP